MCIRDRGSIEQRAIGHADDIGGNHGLLVVAVAGGGSSLHGGVDGFLGHVLALNAVSYTHLDVYKRQQHTQPCYRKTIDKTTYVVRVHFSENAKETMEDKIKRLLREEVAKM